MSSSKRINIKNTNGQSLAVIFFSSLNPTDNLIVACHGFAGTKEGNGKAIEMAEFFSNKFNVVLFDFRGCGESQGRFEDITLTGQIDDLNSVIKWAKQEGFNKIGCVGRSFGGTTAICAASENKDIYSVVTWAAPADLESVFNMKKYEKDGEFFIIKGIEKEVKVKQTFFEDIKRYNVYRLVRDISPRPIFIIHGDKDEVVSCESAYKLYNVANDPKRLEIISNDDHIFSKNYLEVWNKTLKWFVEMLL